MNVYSYIVSHDSGFAPNPFLDYCTLACCKPVIRRTASVGDWIIGLSPKKYGNNIVYVMRVTEKLSFADYWNDKRFRKKRANVKTKDPIQRVGDNIYKPTDKKKYLQMPSRHANNDGSENHRKKEHDLNGKYVLISDDYLRDVFHGACRAVIGREIQLKNAIRHSFGMTLLRKGYDIWQVSKAMNHSDIRMTEHYAKMLSKEVEGMYGPPELRPLNGEK